MLYGRNHGATGIRITKRNILQVQEIAVGYHSGSHSQRFNRLIVLAKKIKLRFGGSIWARVDIGVGRDLPAVSVWGLSFQDLEQQGFSKCWTRYSLSRLCFRLGSIRPCRKVHERHEAGSDRARYFAGELSAFYLTRFRTIGTSKVDVRPSHPVSALFSFPTLEEMDTRTQASEFMNEGCSKARTPTVDYAASVAA